MTGYVTAEEAVKLIKSGEKIFVHGGAATPELLLEALCNRSSELKGVEFYHLHTHGNARYARPEFAESFSVSNFFVGDNVRPFMGNENVQYIPAFLSEIPSMFRRGVIKLNTALIQVSQPDIHGFCSLGVSVDIAKAAIDTADKVIALVNPSMPRSHGDGLVHMNRFSAAVFNDHPLHEIANKTCSEDEMKIGKHVASLIENGSTLQAGIGGIPGSVFGQLSGHKNLGIHTEMFTDAILPLVESGVINGSMKKVHPGKIVSGFAVGTKKLYDFIHDNPMVAMLDAGYVNDTSVIRKNKKVVAINSAIEVDLSGQVCADSLGCNIYSGVGGQMDFIRGASLSEGGKPIIALLSQTKKGTSKIVAMLKQGAGVVTTRAHVHYIVTEYGVVDLYGKNISQRAKALISIAHPDSRELLERAASELYG
jgi:4-hydroxybutyrate CoA-transferase